jgi:hypothetical protein
MNIKIDERELGTILAGLRLWQEYLQSKEFSPDHMDIATNIGMFEPLSPDEIDELCERINQ